MMLEIKGLGVSYGAIKALHDVTLSVEQGQIVTLIGCNGAGKSTTLRAVSGLVKPSRGTVLFEGRPLEVLPPHRIVSLGVSQAPEGRGIFANMSVAENLALGAFQRRDKAAIASDLRRMYQIPAKAKCSSIAPEVWAVTKTGS